MTAFGEGDEGMKRMVLLCLLAALLLAGCAAPSARDAGGSGAQKTAAAAAPQAELAAVQVRAEARPLSDEDIRNAYEQAVTAYGWFELYPLPDTGETVTLDGVTYRRVDTRNFKVLEDLREHLNQLFAPAVTERLLAVGGKQPMYRDIDGALYVTGQGRSRDLYKGEAGIQAERVSDTEYSVNVTVNLLDDDRSTVTGLECWAFPYVFNGEYWVFGDFRLIY